jgi:hypothetical protein
MEYKLDTKFSFGKFKGKSLEEVIEIQLSYINWCVQNISGFFISPEVYKKIKAKKPKFKLYREDIKEMASKLNISVDMYFFDYDFCTYIKYINLDYWILLSKMRKNNVITDENGEDCSKKVIRENVNVKSKISLFEKQVHLLELERAHLLNSHDVYSDLITVGTTYFLDIMMDIDEQVSLFELRGEDSINYKKIDEMLSAFVNFSIILERNDGCDVKSISLLWEHYYRTFEHLIKDIKQKEKEKKEEDENHQREMEEEEYCRIYPNGRITTYYEGGGDEMDYDDSEESSYCGSCEESPCMCSDREKTSMTWN